MVSMRMALLVLVVLLAAGFVAAPGALLMIPTRAHTARELEWAFFFVRWAPWFLASLGAFGLFLAWSGFHHAASRKGRAVPVVLLFALLTAIGFSFARPAENVFAPITRASFVPGGSVDFLEPEDMVLGVSIDGFSRAYPVGQLVYHHLVNDVVAGVPIVATF